MQIFATMVRYIPYRKILFGLLFHPHKQRPLIFATLKLLASSRAHVGDHLETLDEHLTKTGGPWIAGKKFTLADVSWVVILDRLAEVDWDPFFWGDDPDLRAALEGDVQV